MPAKVCDRVPCESMEKAMKKLFYDGTPEDERFQLLVLVPDTKPSKQVPMVMAWEYCPFCGTRIDFEWVKALKERTQKRGG